MKQRWFFTQFFKDPELNFTMPVCAAYGGDWVCPLYPADTATGWALVLMWTSGAQTEAARQDSRVVVCPLAFDPSPVPKAITDAYAGQGAAEGMSMGALLAALSEWMPAFGH